MKLNDVLSYSFDYHFNYQPISLEENMEAVFDTLSWDISLV